MNVPVRRWLGVRYARAERFAPPQPVSFDPDGEYDRYGAAPLQRPPAMPPLGAEPDEDCHFLNVWAPEGARTGSLPVYFCIYGGGFENGAGSAWTADGERIAATGRAVVVSANYRVGALGFMSLDHEGGPFAGASNLGLQDVVAALRWVQENIARFGGDASRVTVVGESAGGFLAAALPAAPAANGLYAQLSIHSAAASRLVPTERARETTAAWLAHLGLTPNELRDADALTLCDAQSAVLSRDIGTRNGPRPHALGVVADAGSPGATLAMHPMQAFEGGAARDVPLLLSATQDEISLFRRFAPDFDPVDEAAVLAEIESWGVSASRARELVAAIAHRLAPEASPGDLREALLTDYIYRLPVVRTAVAHAAAGGRAHLVMFGGADGVPAGHAMDVPALVGRHAPDASADAVSRDDAMFAAVLDFVTGEELPWAAVDASAPTVSAFGVGELRAEASEQFTEVLRTWAGIPRP